MIRRACTPSLVRSLARLLVAASAPGCVSDSSADGGVVRETLPDGSVLLRYGTLSAPDAPLLEADLRLGGVEGDPLLTFGDVRGIDAGSDGTIYVLDYLAAEVHAYGPDGGYLRTVASRGEGPGEITEANGLILVGDTILWVQDHAVGVNLGLSPLGGELARVPMHVRRYGYMWNGTVDARGRFWKPDRNSMEEPILPPEGGLVEEPFREYLVVFDPATATRDSVYLGRSTARYYFQPLGETARAFLPIPSEAAPITVVDPDGGFWRTEAETYRIARLDERGDTVLVIEVEAEGPAITPADRAEYVEQQAGGRPQYRRAAEAVAELMPETKPIVSSLVVDDEGRLWVRRTVSEGEAAWLDAFSRDGDYLGTVRLGFDPAPFLPVRIRHGHLYARVLDELDVPTVVRARVPELGRQ